MSRTTGSRSLEGEYVSLSDRVVVFTNRVIERVTARHPDVLFGYYAYSYYKIAAHAPTASSE